MLDMKNIQNWNQNSSEHDNFFHCENATKINSIEKKGKSLITDNHKYLGRMYHNDDKTTSMYTISWRPTFLLVCFHHKCLDSSYASTTDKQLKKFYVAVYL